MVKASKALEAPHLIIDLHLNRHWTPKAVRQLRRCETAFGQLSSRPAEMGVAVHHMNQMENIENREKISDAVVSTFWVGIVVGSALIVVEEAKVPRG